MVQLPAEGSRKAPAPAYHRHKPEQTCLYQVVERYWPEFRALLEESGRNLPRHVPREFEKRLEQLDDG